MTLYRYRNPFRKVADLVPMRIDQGVDYAGHGPVYSPGRGVVLLYQHSTGWPGPHGQPGALIAVRLTRGRAKGLVYYLAENVTLLPSILPGDVVTRWKPIATLNLGFPNCEMGWADPSGFHPLARDFGGYDEGDCTLAGRNFSAFLEATGAPPGHCQGPLKGSLPAGFPKW